MLIMLCPSLHLLGQTRPLPLLAKPTYLPELHDMDVHKKSLPGSKVYLDE